jgi:SAM-dependent methyltransferase
VSASKRIIGLYEENAAVWDRQRGRDLREAAWLERFAARLPERGTVLDIGCGMGEPVARWFIERGYRVTGIDSAPSLIAMAKERFPGEEWIVADMRALDIGGRFDGLLAWHSFFHLSPADQRPMFARFAAHAAPGAPLMFTSGPEHGEAIGEWMGEPLYHGSLAPADYEGLLAANGFAPIERRLRDPGCGESTVWLALRL